MALRISEAEYRRRRERIFARLEDRGIEALVLFGGHHVGYFCRFAFIATERPIAAVVTRDRAELLVPRLEVEHAEENALVDAVNSYPEYPGLRPPLQFLADMLERLSLSRARLGVDSNGYGRVYGSRGPKLSDLLPDAHVEDVMDDIEYLQMINADEEIALIRESVKWGNLAHTYLQEFCQVGVSETEISMRASLEATLAMLRTLGPSYRAGVGRTGAHAGFRGQIGKDSALPHAISTNVRLRPGDVLVTGADSAVWGYGSELERTMIMGEPTREQEKFFNLMFEVQTAAIEALRPGIPCSAVDDVTNRFFRENGLEQYWRHHTGHAKSQLVHEAPFLDQGDHRTIEVGMVFTVEPGIYVPGFAGFRHSDTVLVTEQGAEFLTYYPRDLQSMIIPV